MLVARHPSDLARVDVLPLPFKSPPPVTDLLYPFEDETEVRPA
jgi:hypothetical protein